jgi:UDP-glucose 4-epimerase
MKNKKVLVTGGAGFIGSHICDKLLESGAEVIVYDNLSSGFQGHIANKKKSLVFIKGDILETARLTTAMAGVSTVFHFAANADVRGGINNTQIDLRENVQGTCSVLEAMRHQNVSNIVFASSATVYGEPEIFPTPESTELLQTSVYGASKLSSEAYIEAYCEYFSMNSYIFRFVSWVGERYSHGVIFDFIKKLKKNPNKLEILGDGKQRKSYLYVKDGVEGIFYALEHATKNKNIFNLGHDQWMNVTDLADIICDEMGLKDTEYTFTGGSRGWLGDSPFVQLDTSRLRELGWSPQTSIEEGIRRTVQYLLSHPHILKDRV